MSTTPAQTEQEVVQEVVESREHSQWQDGERVEEGVETNYTAKEDDLGDVFEGTRSALCIYIEVK